MNKPNSKKDEDYIKTINLDVLEANVKANSSKFKKVIESFKKNTSESNLNKNRVRPRHPDEEKILKRFKKQ